MVMFFVAYIKENIGTVLQQHQINQNSAREKINFYNTWDIKFKETLW